MTKHLSSKPNGLLKFLLLSSLVFMTSCSKKEFDHVMTTNIKDPIDREINLSRGEFKDRLRPYKDATKELPLTEKVSDEEEALPYSPVILAPDDPSIVSSKLVTLSVTAEVPISDVLVELARLADLELALDANITGGIILKVKDRPVKDVIEIVADQASLRYSVENGVLKVQKDGAYLVTYNVDYINLNRSSKSSISTQTQVLSADSSSGSSSSSSSSSSGSSGSSGGLNSGSSNEITSSYDGDIWASVESNVKQIISVADQGLLKDTKVAATGNSTEQQQLSSYYTINKQAGIINVMAETKKHKAVKKYLDNVKASISAQVLIEAKIVEVTLSEQYSAGIDWGRLSGKGFTGTFSYAPAEFKDFIGGTFSTSQITKSQGTHITNVLKLLEGFGTTRTLSNPRISAINNQQAILTFAKNKPYFTISGTLEQTATSASGTGTTPVTITSTLHTIPIGIILSLQPSINLETQEVTMNIRPTLSRETDSPVNDPAVTILAASAKLSGTNIPESAIPVVEVRELDTVLKAKSGDVMVIGGLIEHIDSNTDTGVPGLSRIPVLGNLAKRTSKSSSVKETIILIQATIVPPKGYYHPQDKKLYETFIQDTRPLTF